MTHRLGSRRPSRPASSHPKARARAGLTLLAAAISMVLAAVGTAETIGAAGGAAGGGASNKLRDAGADAVGMTLTLQDRASGHDRLVATAPAGGEVSFSGQRLIAQSPPQRPQEAVAADLDGDGDLDVLSASYNDDTIAWYPNQGAGQFGALQVISTAADHAWSVATADLDGDGDPDVLSASRYDDKIAWYENQGTGQLGAQQVISTAANGAYDVATADLDGDGDLDVLSASAFDDKIAWYPNQGAGRFGAEQVISTAADVAYAVATADLDGDGDLDVLSASSRDNKIAWYPNQGAGRFGAQQVISTAAVSPRAVAAADLDGDGDVDVLSASFSDDKIAWYPNRGAGQFGPQQVLSTAADGAWSVTTADLDGDGDIDVLSVSRLDDKVAWYPNQGAGQFGAQQVISTAGDYPGSVAAADLDGDGDLDVLSASSRDDRIAWYETFAYPRVDAGSDQSVDEGGAIAFSGSFTDPDSIDGHSIRWTFGDGTEATDTLNPTHSYADNGSYTATLTVTDNEGASGTDALAITVSNVAPTANAGNDQSAAEGASVQFNGTHTDPGTEDTHGYAWTFGDGTSATGPSPTHSYADNGSYTATLNVTDNDGGIGTDTLTVTVANVSPTANAGNDQSADEGAVVQFTGSQTDPGSADTHTYAWTFGDGNTATGASPTHSYADNGRYTVTLTVTDDDSGSDSDALTVTVANVAPSADAGGDRIVEENVVVEFTAGYSDPGSADTHTFAWTFDDGSTATGPSPTHAFTEAGRYDVSLTVTDDDGGSSTDWISVQVEHVFCDECMPGLGSWRALLPFD